MQPSATNSSSNPIELKRTLKEIKTTKDAIDPLMRLERGRRHVQDTMSVSIKLNLILASLLTISIVLNLGLAWFATHPNREYFASDNGRIFPLIPMSQPYRKAADIIQYGRDCLNRSFTLDFLNWRSQLEDSRQCYTRDGFKSFIAGLQQSSLLESVRQRRMNMSISAGTGVLIKEGLQDGIYQWFVELPIEVKLAGQNSELPPQRFLATIKVERISTLDSITGVSVSQLVTKPL